MRLSKSFGHALRGLAALLSTQANARIHAVVAVGVIVAGISFRVSRSEWCWLIVAIAIVFMAEAFNTAVEILGDAVSAEPNPLVGRAKDVAAGAVLLGVIAAAIIGVIILLPHVVDGLFGAGDR